MPSPRRAHRDGPGRRHSADRGPDGRPGPGRRLPSLVALVLVAVLCAVGLVFLALQFAGLARVFSSEAALAVLLGAVTLAFGFWVLRRIRPVRAPALNASLTAVAWGLTAAPAAGVLANGGLSSIWAKGLGLAFSGSGGPR